MKQIIKISSLLLLAIALITTTSCSSTKKGQCGCTGMVGYK